MSNELYTKLSKKINQKLKKDGPSLIHAYEHGDFPLSERVNNLNRRFRWDLFWHVVDNDKSIYPHITVENLHNDHIDTALARIVPKIDKKF